MAFGAPSGPVLLGLLGAEHILEGAGNIPLWRYHTLPLQRTDALAPARQSRAYARRKTSQPETASGSDGELSVIGPRPRRSWLAAYHPNAVGHRAGLTNDDANGRRPLAGARSPTRYDLQRLWGYPGRDSNS